MEFPFEYATNKDIILKQLPNCFFSKRDRIDIKYQNVFISEVPGDCGCLLIRNLYYLTPKTFKDIENFASLNGYSKIICSLSEEHSRYSAIKILLEKINFTIIDTGISNRSTNYNYGETIYDLKTWFCIKVINPIQKGYV
jgi:uncharacterized protein YecE (DUF72 family)